MGGKGRVLIASAPSGTEATERGGLASVGGVGTREDDWESNSGPAPFKAR